MGRRFDNILGTVGHTPVVRINRLAPPGIELFVKLESFNPMGSVKDRLALGVIEDAERRGQLKPGQTVIEATSGNTGIGLAMVCAQKGYPLVVTMAENFSVERRRMMRFLGARVVLTPAAEKGSGMLAKAVELAARHGWFLCRQFENEANAEFHSRTTAVEIVEDFADVGLDCWVTGFGTGGTLKGVARVLREQSPATRIVVCEPDNSPLLGSGLRQSRAADGAPAASHPSFRPHLMQGWTPDFISGLTEEAVNEGLIDEVVPVSGDEALRLSRELACREGIFCGITAGATLAGGLQLARRSPPGTRILCMLPDTGERYLSTPLFADIETEMTAQELEISRSTPGYRFDRPSSAPPAPAAPAVAATPGAEAFLTELLSDPDRPVVMFALEWCEFCWSLRKLFARLALDYHSVDLDSARFQRNSEGTAIRAALSDRTGCVTIPQVFIGGDFVGGCTEVFDEFGSGRLQQRLQDAGVAFDSSVSVDPYSLLPAWLHPRS
ncbi:pyridoxal-phosphate dependent enzyme [Marinobacterium aestuariivivens]|uniref:cysteine synthase n=1 Tax=Marinobacterium aestuariivivens TaxID=1698799 RepID=A0ABW2A306_9GAMM